MKLRITSEQLDDLSEMKQQALMEICKTTSLPLLSIGEMIEILDKSTKFRWNEGFYILVYNDCDCKVGTNTGQWSCDGSEYKSKEICDALWEAVKSAL